VRRQAQNLAISVRRATRQFPRSGYGSLQSQITRAAESVVLTIVEGCGAASQREFARFLDIVIKSSRELEAQLELAKDYGVLAQENWHALTKEVVSDRTAPNLDPASPTEGHPPTAVSAPPPR
jgi:four helix bundle protein